MRQGTAYTRSHQGACLLCDADYGGGATCSGRETKRARRRHCRRQHRRSGDSGDGRNNGSKPLPLPGPRPLAAKGAHAPAPGPLERGSRQGVRQPPPVAGWQVRPRPLLHYATVHRHGVSGRGCRRPVLSCHSQQVQERRCIQSLCCDLVVFDHCIVISDSTPQNNARGAPKNMCHVCAASASPWHTRKMPLCHSAQHTDSLCVVLLACNACNTGIACPAG